MYKFIILLLLFECSALNHFSRPNPFPKHFQARADREIFSGISPEKGGNYILEIENDLPTKKVLKGTFRRFTAAWMQDEHVISAGISMEKDYLMLNKTNPKKYNFSSEYNAIKSSIYIGIIVDDGDSDYEESYIYQVTMPRIPTQGLEPILESKTGISERVDNRISDLKNSSIVRKIDFSYPFYFLKNQKAPVAFADKFSVFIPERSHQIKLGETWERTLYRNVIGICRFPNSDEKNTEILLEAKFRFRFSGIVRLKSKIYYVIDFVREEYPEGPKGLFSTDWKAQLEKLDENIPYENAFLQREWKDVGLRSIGRIYYDLDQRSVFLSRSFGQKYEDVSSAKFFFSEDFDLDSNP